MFTESRLKMVNKMSRDPRCNIIIRTITTITGLIGFIVHVHLSVLVNLHIQYALLFVIHCWPPVGRDVNIILYLIISRYSTSAACTSHS